MNARFHLLIVAMFASATADRVSAAAPAYVIDDIMTGVSPSASRSTTWRPGDGLVLETRLRISPETDLEELAKEIGELKGVRAVDTEGIGNG